jgi:hypothetical protein
MNQHEHLGRFLPKFFATPESFEYRWYVESVSQLPEGLCVTFRCMYPKDTRSACMTLRYNKDRVELRHETCDMGPFTLHACEELQRRVKIAMRRTKS